MAIIRAIDQHVSYQAPPRLIFTLIGVTIALTGHAATGERFTVISVVTRGTSLKGETITYNNLNANILYITLNNQCVQTMLFLPIVFKYDSAKTNRVLKTTSLLWRSEDNV